MIDKAAQYRAAGYFTEECFAAELLLFAHSFDGWNCKGFSADNVRLPVCYMLCDGVPFRVAEM